MNFVSYRAVPVQVINKSGGSPNKNGIDVCSKSDKTNNINIDNDHSLMQSQTKSHTNLSESSAKCDNNNESIGENTTKNPNANTNANANANANAGGNVNVNPSVLMLNDGAQSGCVNSSSGNGNMISVTDNANNSHPNHTSQVQLNQQTRTFTSTEAQTDDLEQQSGQDQPVRQNPPATDSSALIESKSTVKNSSKPNSNHSHGRRNGIDTAEAQSSREQRRRERRERRQPRNARQQQHGHVHPPSNPSMALHSHAHSNCELLPDILHNHVISHPPPYTTLPMPTHCQINAAHSVLTQSPPPSVLVPGPPSALIPIGISDDGRYTFPLPIIRR